MSSQLVTIPCSMGYLTKRGILQLKYPIEHGIVTNWDDPVLDGVLELEDPPLGLGLVSNVDLLLSHAGHVSLVLGTAHDGREDTSGGVISGEPGLAHSGPIVHDKSLNFFVTHLGLEQRLLGP